jgi:arsenate reductase-like glutaredoxin family protein
LQEVAHAEIIRALKVEQAKELTKLRQEFELQARELGSKYEKKMKMLRDDLELRRKQEIHEIEEHKVSLITYAVSDSSSTTPGDGPTPGQLWHDLRTGA